MASDDTLFPPLPAGTLDRAEIVRYLTNLKGQGHHVYRDAVHDTSFYIQLDDAYRIRIIVTQPGAQVQLYYLENLRKASDVASVDAFERAIRDAVSKVPGFTWPFRPVTGRLSSETPASNYRAIGELVGTSQVLAIFDPWLTNLGLEQLGVILSFGEGTVADGIRLLGSTNTTQAKPGAVPRFTKAGVDSWLSQLSVTGEARIGPSSEHRRFLLLSGGQSLLLGLSLNSLHKNEAIRVESDAADRPFFDASWVKATPFT